MAADLRVERELVRADTFPVVVRNRAGSRRLADDDDVCVQEHDTVPVERSESRSGGVHRNRQDRSFGDPRVPLGPYVAVHRDFSALNPLAGPPPRDLRHVPNDRVERPTRELGPYEKTPF